MGQDRNAEADACGIEQCREVIAPEHEASMACDLGQPALLRHLVEAVVVTEKLPRVGRSAGIAMGCVKSIPHVRNGTGHQARRGGPGHSDRQIRLAPRQIGVARFPDYLEVDVLPSAAHGGKPGCEKMTGERWRRREPDRPLQG